MQIVMPQNLVEPFAEVCRESEIDFEVHASDKGNAIVWVSDSIHPLDAWALGAWYALKMQGQ